MSTDLEAAAEKIAELEAAARRARDVLRQISLMRRKIGPLATEAQSAAWQLSFSLGEEEDPRPGMPSEGK